MLILVNEHTKVHRTGHLKWANCMIIYIYSTKLLVTKAAMASLKLFEELKNEFVYYTFLYAVALQRCQCHKYVNNGLVCVTCERICAHVYIHVYHRYTNSHREKYNRKNSLSWDPKSNVNRENKKNALFCLFKSVLPGCYPALWAHAVLFVNN